MTTDPSPADEPSRFDTLIGVDALRGLLARGAPLRTVDCSFDLADPAAGARSHAAARLPAARYADLERDLSGPKQPRADGRPGFSGGRHPLPERAAFAATVGRLGVAPGLQVVAYDRQGGVYASRLWWLLRWLGHRDTAVLDGGFAAWAAAGGAVESGPPDGLPAQPPYPFAALAGGAAGSAAGAVGGSADGAGPTSWPDAAFAALDADDVARRLGRWPLIDARAAERYRGDVEPLDARAGHIPGALNRPFTRNLAADGRFKPADLLRAEFAPLLGDGTPADVVHQCGSGVTACHNLLAMEHAGLHGSRLYAGSWSDWSSDPSRPVASG